VVSLVWSFENGLDMLTALSNYAKETIAQRSSIKQVVIPNLDIFASGQ
jgi:hypothetical protein